MSDRWPDERVLITEVNACAGVALDLVGRAEHGSLGGAVLVRWPDGRPGVVTVFHGSAAAARCVADTVNELHRRGLPVARHELVVDLGHRVVLVQERLPAAPTSAFSPARADGICAINDAFAGAASDLGNVPRLARWFDPALRGASDLPALVPPGEQRALLLRVAGLARASVHLLEGDDVVHVDLTAANVLFDVDDRPTGVVDWNLGMFRGDRRAALVQTRFDREWFVSSPDADAAETGAAHRLDAHLAARMDREELRGLWALWLLHHLGVAVRQGDRPVVSWQMRLAASRLGER